MTTGAGAVPPASFGLRDEAITAGFGHQDLGMRRIALDFLAQAINMGFERVGRDRGVVAPHFAEQHVARDRLIAGPMEVFEDRRLFSVNLTFRPPLGSVNSLALGRKV